MFLFISSFIYAYSDNNSGGLRINFENGAGKVNINNTENMVTLIIGGQIKTFISTNNNTNLYEGLLKMGYELEETGKDIIKITLPISEDGGKKYYDLRVSTKNNLYYLGQVVYADITFINLGRNPDRDGRLVYYLKFNNDKYLDSSEYFELVPVGETKIERDILLPVNAEVGQWYFCAEYETFVQEKLTVCDAFQLTTYEDYRRQNMIKIAIAILLISVMLCICFFVIKKDSEDNKKLNFK